MTANAAVGSETKLGDEIVDQVRERYGKIAEGKIGLEMLKKVPG